MSFIRYIRDCIHFAKKYPFEDGSKRIWLRNVLYINSQPKYLYGRIIDKLLSRTKAKETKHEEIT